jgi:hypothetical protein
MKKFPIIVAAAIVGLFILAGCKEKAEEVSAVKEEPVKEEKTLAGKRVVMIIAPENFRDEELIEPQNVLTEKGGESRFCVHRDRQGDVGRTG